MQHAALVHLPIGASLVGLGLSVFYLLGGGRSRTLGWCVLCVYLGVIVSSQVAQEAGELAKAEMGAIELDARQVVASHERLARRVWLPALLTVLATALSLGPGKRLVSNAGLVACPLAALGTCAWVGLVGHLGGTAAWVHAVGIPTVGQATEAGGTGMGDARTDHFVSEIRPLIESRCAGCHGPGEFAASGLDMSSMDSVLLGGQRGPALVPGNSTRSLMMQSISGTHPELMMPLGLAPLTMEEQEALALWIDSGAVWVK